MKKILAIFAAVLTYTGAANAQVATVDNANTNTAVTTTTVSSDESCYCCPKGDYCSSQPGTCALHVNVNLVKDGEYYCPMEDNISSSTGGVCPASGKELKQMKGKCSKNDGEKKEKKEKKEKSKETNEGTENNSEQEPGTTGK